MIKRTLRHDDEFPELAHCRDEKERQEALFAAREGGLRQHNRNPRLVRGYAITGLIGLVVIFGAMVIRPSMPSWVLSWVVIPLMLLAQLAFMNLFMFPLERQRRLVRKYLLSRGVPLCQSCGYDLSVARAGVTPEDKCPECGKAMGEVATLLQRSRDAS